MWDECCVSRGFWRQTRYDSLFSVVLCPENDRFWQPAVCSCPPGHSGNPLSHCSRAECLDHTECRGDMACRNGVCVNPCAGSCGVNANCEVSLSQFYPLDMFLQVSDNCRQETTYQCAHVSEDTLETHLIVVVFKIHVSITKHFRIHDHWNNYCNLLRIGIVGW